MHVCDQKKSKLLNATTISFIGKSLITAFQKHQDDPPTTSIKKVRAKIVSHLRQNNVFIISSFQVSSFNFI